MSIVVYHLLYTTIAQRNTSNSTSPSYIFGNVSVLTVLWKGDGIGWKQQQLMCARLGGSGDNQNPMPNLSVEPLRQ